MDNEIDLKKYLIGFGLILLAISLLFSIYLNFRFSQKYESFSNDYDQFKEDWISEAYDLQIIRGEPQVYEQYFDSCNENELSELIETLNQTLSDLDFKISEFKAEVKEIKNSEKSDDSQLEPLTYSNTAYRTEKSFG